MEGHWKLLGEGGGVLKAKFFEAMYEYKLEFPGGAKQKTFHGGSMDIFWNCPIIIIKFMQSFPYMLYMQIVVNTCIHVGFIYMKQLM